MDWSEGCVRDKELNCSLKNHQFSKVTKIKLPDTTTFWVNKSMNLKQCQAECLRNYTCTAYTNSVITTGGTGFAIWFGDLVDMRQLQEDGQDIYLRMPYSKSESENDRRTQIVAFIVLVPVVIILGPFIVAFDVRKRNRSKVNSQGHVQDTEEHKLDLPVLNLASLARATENFSDENKIGEGGFGPVSKGLLDGQEIAVKRLSRRSEQGEVEFKNEATSIA